MADKVQKKCLDDLIMVDTSKQASGYQREMHYDETPRFLKLFPL
jgi:hypothetical protein